MATNELSIKLMIDTKANKLCFAEAGSDVVEFLTGVLSLPLGTLTSLVAKENMAGSVGTLLRSAEKLEANYDSKRHMSPVIPLATLSRLQQLLGVQFDGNVQLFTCQGRVSYTTTRYNCGYLSAISGTACPSCQGAMIKAMTLIGAGTYEGTAAATTQPKPTYTIKDDLSVTPVASMSVITLLAQCGVKDLSVLQEKVVKIGKKEALEIISVAFKSKTVLTDVFLSNVPKKNTRCKREPPEDVVQI